MRLLSCVFALFRFRIYNLRRPADFIPEFSVGSLSSALCLFVSSGGFFLFLACVCMCVLRMAVNLRCDIIRGGCGCVYICGYMNVSGFGVDWREELWKSAGAVN